MKPTDPHGAPRRYDDGVVHQPHYAADGHDDMHNNDVAHEHSDVNLRAILSSAGVIAVVMVISWILMYFLFGWFESHAASTQIQTSTVAPAPTTMPGATTSPFFSQGVSGPQLLTNEPMALQATRAEWAERLGSYGWVDQNAGVARVPIEEAKKLLLNKGLPVREGAEAPSFAVRPWVRGEASGGRTVTVDLPDRQDGTPQAPAGHGDGTQPHGGGAPAATPAAPAPGGHAPAPKPSGPGGH